MVQTMRNEVHVDDPLAESGDVGVENGLRRLRESADLEAANRVRPSAFLDILLFASILGLTPLSRRFPWLVAIFGAAVLVLSVLKWFLTSPKSAWVRRRRPWWRKAFLATVTLSALSFGTFCAIAVAAVELSWSSFFVILVTCGVCAGLTSALAPNYRLLKQCLYSLLLPVLITNVGYVGGLRGNALGALFGGFLILLLLEGRLQNRSYWLLTQSTARLQAMIEAMPGTLSWITADLKYLGVNGALADMWKKKPADFVGQPLGFADPKTGVGLFMRTLFESQGSQQVEEIDCRIQGENRNFYFVGRKCNHDTEAIIMGIDLTDYRRHQEEFTKQKAQALHSAKLAGIGEMLENVTESIAEAPREIRSVMERLPADADRSSLDSLLRRVDGLHRALAHFTAPADAPSTDICELVEDACVFVAERFAKAGIELKVVHAGVPGVRSKSEVLQVLIHLLQNSFDAVSKARGSWVRIDTSHEGGFWRLSVTDSGLGVRSELREKIFEPLFSTKNTQRSTGLGLSLARGLLEGLGGTLTLDVECANTRFVIRLPV